MHNPDLSLAARAEAKPRPGQGAHLAPDGVIYRLWAPEVRELEVEITGPENSVRRVPLARDGEGWHCGRDPKGSAGDRYKYVLDHGGRLPDPASRWQPLGVHGCSMVIDPESYRWKSRSFQRPPFRDLVIYELHVGTFTTEGTFRGVIGKLSFLQSLGVNAIELMPVADFAGERNWGYDGVCLYAPAHSYGHPDDLRALVDAAHGLGLAVILDVVYNHFGPDGNYLAAYLGEYLDEEAKTAWGGAIRYGSPAFRPLREFVMDNIRYWLDEFRVDGFRLDATHAIVDGSQRHLLAEITDLIHERAGYAIAEDSRNDSELLRPTEHGGFGFDAVWADDFHHIVRVAQTQEKEGYFRDFSGALTELVTVLREGWYYSGQLTPSAKRRRGTSAASLQPAHCLHCISNHDQVGNRALGERLSHAVSPDAYRAASLLLCLSPHTPMLFMGQEWAASTPFLFFTDHRDELGRLISAGRRNEFKDFAAFRNGTALETIPDPQDPCTFSASRLEWSELKNEPHAGILELYRAGLALRCSDACFRPGKREDFQVAELPVGICALNYSSEECEWLLLIDLRGGHHGGLSCWPALLSGPPWQRVLSTRERRFGGDGGSGVNNALTVASFDLPEAVLFKRSIPR